MSAPIQINHKKLGIPETHTVAFSAGGTTLFATSPGGTRHVYDAEALRKLSKSPLAQSPPKMPNLAGFTSPQKKAHPPSPMRASAGEATGGGGDELFKME